MGLILPTFTDVADLTNGITVAQPQAGLILPSFEFTAVTNGITVAQPEVGLILPSSGLTSVTDGLTMAQPEVGLILPVAPDLGALVSELTVAQPTVILRLAAAAELTPQQLVDQVAGRFERMWARLVISHDQFIRTTAGEHKAGVRELIERIFERDPDDFYEQSYRGRYCVGCESFKQDAEVVDDRCELHPTRTLEWVEEQNWFFRLSRYRDFLLELIEKHPGFVQPESRRNEILGLLHQGLDDITASRSRFTWGVPFPRLTSQGEQQTTYVWFDALPNYWTATRAPSHQVGRQGIAAQGFNAGAALPGNPGCSRRQAFHPAVDRGAE